MELAQVAQIATPGGGLALLGTALTLGLRHGIDWDHVAAISDITGTASGRTPRSAASGGATAGMGVTGTAWHLPATARAQVRAVWLATVYALGHALVVLGLGLAALRFRAILPDWVDPIMERLVGVTLLALGFWVVYSLVRFWRGDGDFRLQSRWMLVFSGVRQAWRRVQARVHGHGHDGSFHVHRVDEYGWRMAFGVGVIHGIGAETGSQVLIIAAVGGAASQGLGTGMLLAFVLGLLLSNAAVALLTCAGFVSASRARALYVAAGCLAAVFSLVVGSYSFLGISDRLPELAQALGL